LGGLEAGGLEAGGLEAGGPVAGGPEAGGRCCCFGIACGLGQRGVRRWKEDLVDWMLVDGVVAFYCLGAETTNADVSF
jgi:hypothetical protein